MSLQTYTSQKPKEFYPDVEYEQGADADHAQGADPDYGDTPQVSYDEGADPDYGDTPQTDYGDDFADRDGGDAGNQEYRKPGKG